MSFLCKKAVFFYKLNGCKNTAFLQKYIFVKKLLFYKNKVVKNQLFTEIYFCEKDAFLRKNPAFLQIDRL